MNILEASPLSKLIKILVVLFQIDTFSQADHSSLMHHTDLTRTKTLHLTVITQLCQ